MHPQNVKRVKFHLNYRHRAIVRDDFFALEQVLLLTHFPSKPFRRPEPRESGKASHFSSPRNRATSHRWGKTATENRFRVASSRWLLETSAEPWAHLSIFPTHPPPVTCTSTERIVTPINLHFSHDCSHRARGKKLRWHCGDVRSFCKSRKSANVKRVNFHRDQNV